MNSSHGTSWQIMLADLSLILFITAAAAISHNKTSAKLSVPPTVPPVAIFRDDKQDGELEYWLNHYQGDARQKLSLVVTYKAGQLDKATARARAMAKTAQNAGLHPRIVIEEGREEAAEASFSYDGTESLAR